MRDIDSRSRAGIARERAVSAPGMVFDNGGDFTCDARAAAWEMVAGRPFTERETLRREVPRAALQARFAGHVLKDLALELVRISDAGLARLPGGEEDRPLLAPLWGYATAGRTPADDLLDDYEAVKGDPAKLVERWELRP